MRTGFTSYSFPVDRGQRISKKMSMNETISRFRLSIYYQDIGYYENKKKKV